MEPQDTTAITAAELELAPESPPMSPWMWARENLFSSKFNSVLTVVALLAIAVSLRGMIGWIFDTGRRWDAVATNMRFYMTQAYPLDQFARMWVSLGFVVSLVGLSLAIWRVGGRMALSTITKALMGAGGFVFVLALLGPPDVDVNIGIPILGGLIGFAIEAVALTGGRLAVAVVGAALFGAGFATRRQLGARAKEMTVHTMTVVFSLVALVVIALWTVPIGNYTFFAGPPAEARYEPGTLAISTKLPLTVMALVLVAGFAVGTFTRSRLPEQQQRNVLLLAWVLSLPIVILIIMRDPEWDYGRLVSVHLPLLIGFVVGGGLLIAILANPRLGEPGRVVAALALIAALVMWAIPMLILIRLLALLLAAFAIGAPTFAGDRRTLVRYLGLWTGLVVLLIYFLAAIDTPSTLIIQGKSFLGGLTLTFVLALTSIALSFPIGVAMALGRTSTMPIFRIVSTLYIELVRGIPFITVLIFFDLILVLFLPEGLELDSVTLAILAGTLFSAAYLAENVRGGLQSIPKGQYEAAKAMGLSTLQLTVFIVLPQALRAVIPALVGQTIAIFKDTSLVAIIGLFDFLFIADKVIPAQTIFLGVKLENLLFISMGYWIFTFSFSRASLRLEKKLGLGER